MVTASLVTGGLCPADDGLSGRNFREEGTAEQAWVWRRHRKKPCALVYPRIPCFKKDWGEGQQNQEGPGEVKMGCPEFRVQFPFPLSSLKNCHCIIH